MSAAVFHRTLAVVVGLASLAACGQRAEEAPVANEAPEAAASSDAPANGSNMAGSSATPAAAASAVFPLDQQQVSKSGVTMQLTSIQMLPTETVVGVKIVNAGKRTAELNGKSYLAGGNGAQFKMRGPEGNPDMKVAPSQTLTGELVFEGRPLPGSDAVLVINEGYNDNEFVGNPPMNFQIPLVQLGYK